MWSGPSVMAMFLTLGFSHHSKACEQQYPPDVEPSAPKPLELGKIYVSFGRRKSLLELTRGWVVARINSLLKLPVKPGVNLLKCKPERIGHQGRVDVGVFSTLSTF